MSRVGRAESPKPPTKKEDDTGTIKATNGASGSTANGTTANGSTANGDKKEPVARKQTRPMGEFGGNFGCGFWTFFLPTYVYYFYGIGVLHEGALANPLSAEFWRALVCDLPRGISIVPTFEAFSMYIGWIALQAALEIFIPPSKIAEGVTLKNGRNLLYPVNGTTSFALSHLLCYALCWFGVIEPQYVWRNMGALISSSFIVAFAIGVWMYVDFGLLWKRHANDPEFEEDWGVFSVKECVHDFWLGVARNPRFFHKWLKVPFDLKRFSNARPGLTIWVILNQSYLAAMYFNCRLDGGEAVCDAVGSWGRIGWAAWMVTAAHFYYVLDYNWNEPAYLTTTDIRHDLYGWMLAFGCLSWVAMYYPVSFLHHIAYQKVPLTNNPMHCAIGTFLHIVGMILFRLTNIQKHRFRSYIAQGGDLSTYKVWGRPVDYIKTEEGNYLLTSGWWALARHFNYIGDLVMCIGWAIACASPAHVFPWAPVSYCAYFWMMDVHRLVRDENRCSKKYKQDWARYKEKVPSFLFPGVW